MISLTSLYVITTLSLFSYTIYEEFERSDSYFTSLLRFSSDSLNIFIVYNVILSIAIVTYKVFIILFFESTNEGEIVKIVDKLKIKLIDIVFFSYIIDLKLDFQVYLVLVVVLFLFILHYHLIFRSEFLIHVHTASNSLKLHYRCLALFVILFFIDYQLIKHSCTNILTINDQSQAMFVYYIIAIAALLVDPFLNFFVDFYEKYTFNHFKNVDQFLATAGLMINIPRLVIQLLISIWITFKFKEPFFLLISGIDNFGQIKSTIKAYQRTKSLTKAMLYLKRAKGEELQKFHDLTCTVCYEDMVEAVVLPCKHIFHDECIRQWIIKNLNHFCPKCKRQFNFDKLQEQHVHQKLYGQQKNNLPQQRFNQFQAYTQQQQKKQQYSEDDEMMKEEYSQNESSKYDRSQFNLNSNKRRRQQQIQREDEVQYRQSPRKNKIMQNQRQSKVSQNIQGRPRKRKHYVVNQPDYSDMTYEQLQKMKRDIIQIGSLPFGMPSIAVANRTERHMAKRREYLKEIDVVLKLINMNPNEQLLFL